jgi:hypothetical protein
MLKRREKIMAVCVVFAIGLMESSVQADIVANWAFNEGAGSTAYDSVGSNNGNIIGATWTGGKYGSALNFNGAGNYVSVAENPSLRFTQTDSFTIAYWAKPAGTNGDILCNMRASMQYGVFGYETQWDKYGRFFSLLKVREKAIQVS